MSTFEERVEDIESINIYDVPRFFRFTYAVSNGIVTQLMSHQIRGPIKINGKDYFCGCGRIFSESSLKKMIEFFNSPTKEKTP